MPYFIKENKINISKVNDNYSISDRFLEIEETCKKLNINAVKVKKLKKQLTTDEIIAKIGGGDLTQGSCASLSLAYAGNKIGYDVLDFRGGASCDVFSRVSNLKQITKELGGIVVENYNDYNIAKALFRNINAEKEYIFICAQHAAIVRRINKKLQYLELQSAIKNGFKDLDTFALEQRFRAKKSHTILKQKIKQTGALIEINKKNMVDKGLDKLLKYINTASGKEFKGIKGKIK